MIRFIKRLFIGFYIFMIFINATAGTISGSNETIKVALLMILVFPAKYLIQKVIFPSIRKRLFA